MLSTWVKTGALSLLVALALTAPAAQASPNELPGSPLTIEGDDNGVFSAILDDGYLPDQVIQAGFSLVVGTTVYGRNGMDFTYVSGSDPGPNTLTSKFRAGADIEVTQTITAFSGAQTFEVKWDIANTALSGAVNVVPRVVGNFDFGGDTNGFGHTDPFGAAFWETAGFDGVGSDDLDARFQEGSSGTINQIADDPNSNFTDGQVNTALTDAGFGGQWGTIGAPIQINASASVTRTVTFSFARLLITSPRSSVQPQGDTATVNVLAQRLDGLAKPGAQIRYSISGANPGSGAAPLTDSNGSTSISWQGTNAGQDLLTVFDDFNGNGSRDSDEPRLTTGSYEFVAGPPPPPPGTPPDAPDAMAAALSGQDGLVTGASWVTQPPGIQGFGQADKVFSGNLGSFPTTGSTFALMTSGDANLANRPQTDTAGAPAGNTDRGANDVSILKVDVNVPSSASCLAFDFQFLSEEYPQFVGSNFNDAFLAELDTNDWTIAGNAIAAPHNFAFDATGAPVSVNSSGVAQMTAQNAAGTVYGGATHALQATSPVTPGPHSVYFSIFDASDTALDTAAFVDGLRTGTGACERGVQPVLDPPKIGQTANAVPEKGTVLVKLPAGTTPKRAKALGLTGAATGFIPLERATQVPMGSTFNTAKGTLGMTTATTAAAPTTGKAAVQTGHFSEGQFVVSQTKKNPLTTLSMNGGGLKACGRPVPKGGAAKVTAARKRSRRLFSSVKGRFRTRGRNSSATVRGTKWTMTDTCGGTKTTVKQGSVVVRDFRLKKNKVVKAGKSYFAKAPKKKGKRRFGR